MMTNHKFYFLVTFNLKMLFEYMENTLNSENILKNLPISTNFGLKPKNLEILV